MGDAEELCKLGISDSIQILGVEVSIGNVVEKALKSLKVELSGNSIKVDIHDLTPVDSTSIELIFEEELSWERNKVLCKQAVD